MALLTNLNPVKISCQIVWLLWLIWMLRNSLIRLYGFAGWSESWGNLWSDCMASLAALNPEKISGQTVWFHWLIWSLRNLWSDCMASLADLNLRKFLIRFYGFAILFESQENLWSEPSLAELWSKLRIRKSLIRLFDFIGWSDPSLLFAYTPKIPF